MRKLILPLSMVVMNSVMLGVSLSCWWPTTILCLFTTGLCISAMILDLRKLLKPEEK